MQAEKWIRGELMPKVKLSDMPAKVRLATRLLYLVVGIGIARTAMTVLRHADVRSPDFLIATKLLTVAASIYLIYQIGKGKNWARWSLIVIFVISIPLTILPAFETVSHNTAHTLLGFVQVGLYVAGLLLVFHRDVSGWFNGKGSPTDP
jgi:uncharacterized membrane protein YfcA